MSGHGLVVIPIEISQCIEKYTAFVEAILCGMLENKMATE
jgi:hypothetical protein